MTEIRLSPRAEAEFERVNRWWREHRPAAPRALESEFRAALAFLARTPEAAPRLRANSSLRRLLLRRTRYHVYYRHDREAGQIEILSIWSARRGRGPTTRKR